MKRLALVAAIAAPLAITAALSCAHADDAPPPPPPTGVWIGKGQLGFVDTTGNSQAQTANANLDMTRYDGAWKNEGYTSGLYGKSAGIVSAERWDARWQTNYTISGKLFAFGGLQYEHDLFDGFEYQASVDGGLGYKFIDSDTTTLTAQAGPGYRRLRPEIIIKNAAGEVTSRTPLDASGEAIGTAGIDFSHKFNASTTLTNKFLVAAGSDNTQLQNQLGLAVKMSTHLALSVGYGVIKNTKPPAPLKQVDTITTVNLQFAF